MVTGGGTGQGRVSTYGHGLVFDVDEKLLENTKKLR